MISAILNAIIDGTAAVIMGVVQTLCAMTGHKWVRGSIGTICVHCMRRR